MFPIWQIGDLEIPMYSFMIIIGIMISFVLGYFLVYKKENISQSTLLRLLLCVVIGGVALFLGASFFDSLFHSIEEKRIGIYGITWLGGVVTGFPVAILCIHYLVPVSKGRALYTFSLLVPLIVLAHGFGRIGCFFAGCCYGRVTDSWMGMVFPEGSLAAIQYPAADGRSLPVIPTMLIEAVFEFILFAVMMILRKKTKGHELEMYLIVYSIFRFILEFFRGDSRGSTGIGLSPAQFLDVICLIAGVLIILFYKKIVFKKTYNKCLVWQEEVKNSSMLEKKEKGYRESPEARIKELYNMKEKGIITEEEFEEKKKKLLEKI